MKNYAIIYIVTSECHLKDAFSSSQRHYVDVQMRVLSYFTLHNGVSVRYFFCESNLLLLKTVCAATQSDGTLEIIVRNRNTGRNLKLNK